MFDFIDPQTLIASGAIVIFLTEQAKRVVPTQWLPLVALFFGIVIQLVNDLALATEAASSGSVWLSIVTGAGVGMVASGAYDLASRTKSEVPPANILVTEDYVPSGDEAYMPADLPEMGPELSDETRANLDWNKG